MQGWGRSCRVGLGASYRGWVGWVMQGWGGWVMQVQPFMNDSNSRNNNS